MGRRQNVTGGQPLGGPPRRENEPIRVSSANIIRPIEALIGDYPSEAGRLIRTFESTQVTKISRFLASLNGISPDPISLAVYGNSFLLDSIVEEDKRAGIEDLLNRAAEIDFYMPSHRETKSLLGNLASTSKRLSIQVTGNYIFEYGQIISEGVFTADQSKEQTREIQNVGDLRDFDDQRLTVSIGLKANEETLQ